MAKIGEAKPETFVLRGRSREVKAVPDLVFTRDQKAPFLLYRADAPRATAGDSKVVVVDKSVSKRRRAG
jgi:hypothetical protein